MAERGRERQREREVGGGIKDESQYHSEQGGSRDTALSYADCASTSWHGPATACGEAHLFLILTKAPYRLVNDTENDRCPQISRSMCGVMMHLWTCGV